jgi:hypothetical protein
MMKMMRMIKREKRERNFLGALKRRGPSSTARTTMMMRKVRTRTTRMMTTRRGKPPLRSLQGSKGPLSVLSKREGLKDKTKKSRLEYDYIHLI